LWHAGPIAPVVVLLAILLVGCTARVEELPDDTARVDAYDRRYELEVISCGLDDEEDVFVLGARSEDSFLQLLLAVEDGEVMTELSAITFETEDTGVVGAGHAALLGARSGEPGSLESASIDGDRIDVVADARPIGEGNGGTGAGEPAEVVVLARCAAAEEVAVGTTSGYARPDRVTRR
jgi:hypothetical protein